MKSKGSHKYLKFLPSNIATYRCLRYEVVLFINTTEAHIPVDTVFVLVCAPVKRDYSFRPGSFLVLVCVFMESVT